MNKKTQLEITSLTNSISSNNSIIESHPEMKEKLEQENKDMSERINIFKNPQTTSLATAHDNGLSCMAIQNNGRQCKCSRKYGNYCKRHLEHYMIEKGLIQNDSE